MPKVWSDKDERQYQHIKESAEQRGAKSKRAKEVAARTVNKERRKRGETPTSRTQGTGNPRSTLDERTRDELYNRAAELDIRGRSRMSKRELIRAIRAQA